MGSVRMRVWFGADGTIGKVTVVQGLPDGLDKKAVEAIRRLVFLPATKNRIFVSYIMPMVAEFNLR